MAARIYQRPKSAMQSGKARIDEWVLEFEQSEARRADPLMGWTGSGDTQVQVQLIDEVGTNQADVSNRNEVRVANAVRLHRSRSSAEAVVNDLDLLDDPEYGGGLARQYDNPGEGEPEGQGWTAMHWNPAVRARFQALLAALGERFDGRLFGVNLPESSFDPLAEEGDANGFTCDAYFDATLDNMRAARAAFDTTHVVQYLNFWPCEWNNDHRYMERAFALAVEQGIGAGGPDIVPHKRAQMKNSYPFFNRHKADLPLVAMAIQEPTLTYTNPETGEKFTREEFVAFARDYLGVDVIFWSIEAPWLAAE